MSDDLYFVPILAQALGQGDVAAALRDAFAQIQAKGRLPRYHRGYRQFIGFMREVGRTDQRRAAQELLDLFAREFRRPDVVAVVVERDGSLVTKCAFPRMPGKRVLGGIRPGTYRFYLDTGRLLWEGTLVREDLIWAEAFPREPLRMTADTGGAGAKPSKQIPLFEGAMVMRVFPGIECGSLELDWATA
jgi:hypothetical protein